ncbi:ligand-binding sensor domain-containing protein [Portibacter lacus]|uniref:Histidine kinase n=1 Tax=Portibacter lacus TaxID=1099794 RepID=A0AA37SRR3_9BACT|nr:two-component regulator propeller domain-containing protein [Portibacter lacus]GLR17616.1 hypothetical protein GCM10007940_22310 [Portibacter lacus]
MNQNLLFSFFAIYLFCIISCQGQAKTEDSKIDNAKPINTKTFLPQSIPNEVDPYFVENNGIGSEYGPAVITRNVLEDKNGDIWLATWNGIIKYDGKVFTNYTNMAGLRRYRVFCILEDSKDNLWFGMIGGGAYKYDGKEFTNFSSADGMSDDNVECITEDADGNIWFGHDLGVSIYTPSSDENTKGTFQNFDASDGIADNDIHDITLDKDGKVWIGSGGGVTIYDGEKFSDFTNKDGGSFHNVRTIMEDRNGHIWFGGNNGLMHYDGRKLTNFTRDFVGYLFEDSKGSIYGSIGSGDIKLTRFKPAPLPIISATWNPEIIFDKGEMNFGISEDREGNIWFGTVGGVYRYDGTEVHSFHE